MRIDRIYSISYRGQQEETTGASGFGEGLGEYFGVLISGDVHFT